MCLCCRGAPSSQCTRTSQDGAHTGTVQEPWRMEERNTPAHQGSSPGTNCPESLYNFCQFMADVTSVDTQATTGSRTHAQVKDTRTRTVLVAHGFMSNAIYYARLINRCCATCTHPAACGTRGGTRRWKRACCMGSLALGPMQLLAPTPLRHMSHPPPPTGAGPQDSTPPGTRCPIQKAPTSAISNA